MRRVATLLLALLPAAIATAGPTVPPPLVLRDVTVIDATGAPPAPHQTVVVRDGRIAAVGSMGEIEVPAGALVVEGAGRFLIPGLWDMHVHAMREGRALWHHPLDLAHGVTGVREMGTYLDSLDFWRQRLASGQVLAPRVVAAGHIVSGPPPPGLAVPSPDRPTSAFVFAVHVTRADQAEAVVDSLVRRGVDFIKVYSRLSREAYFAIASASRGRGVPFAGHVTASVTVGEAAEAGQASIEHLTGMLPACIPGWNARGDEYEALLESGLPRDSLRTAARALFAGAAAAYDPQACGHLFAAFAEHGTRHVPTLVQMLGARRTVDPAAAEDPRRRFVPARILARWQPSPAHDPVILDQMLRLHSRIVGDLHRAGVAILAGTDASDEAYVFPGSALHEELALLVEAGLTPLEAVQAATREPARFLGMEEDFGTIEVGKHADLILLEADPLADIRNTQRIEAVVLGGRLLDRTALDGLLRQAEAAAEEGVGL